MAPDGRWGETDRLLASALEVDVAARCAGGCGHYTDEAHDDENEGAFEVEQVVCHACAARDQWQQDRKDRPEPGSLTWVRKLVRGARRHYTGRG